MFNKPPTVLYVGKLEDSKEVAQKGNHSILISCYEVGLFVLMRMCGTGRSSLQANLNLLCQTISDDVDMETLKFVIDLKNKRFAHF